MSIFDLARRPSAWLRVALAVVVLAFALDSVAHVVHRHDDSAKTLTAHGPACGYCAAFDGVADVPRHHYAPHAAFIVAGYVAPDPAFPVSARTHLRAQPRAPPR